MRPAAVIKEWMDLENMFRWLQDAPDQASYQRRLAIWLTHTGRLHAYKVAQTLGVSTQAVWLWIHEYNQLGPEGLERIGRGGRRWGLLTWDQEKTLIDTCRQNEESLKRGQLLRFLKQTIEQHLGREVSRVYVYRVLSRHRRQENLTDSGQVTSRYTAESFRKLTQPWRRKL